MFIECGLTLYQQFTLSLSVLTAIFQVNLG